MTSGTQCRVIFLWLFLQSYKVLCVTHVSRCPESTFRVGEYPSCYWFSTQQTTWDDAKAQCTNRNSQLIIINSQLEMVNLNSTLVGSSFWVGLNDKEEEGTWKWVDKSSTDLRSLWLEGSPDNIEVVENCAEYMIDNNNINDQSCTHRIHYVCKKVVPHPSECVSPWFLQNGTGNCVWMDLKAHQRTFQEARGDCSTKGADLAVPHTIQELKWIQSLLLANDPHYSVWLGLRTVDETSRIFKWIDGTPHDVSFLPWNAGEPNGERQDEDCAVFADRYLQDKPCFYAYRFICETPLRDLPFCEWPSRFSALVSTCEHPSKGHVTCANFLENGVIALFSCPSHCRSMTGIPFAFSVCQDDGSWSRVDGFTCDCPKGRREL